MISLPFSLPIIDALGWTIVHSLWQATLLGGLLWITSRTISSAQLRYRLAYGTLLSQLLLSCLTFAYCYEPLAAPIKAPLAEGNLTFLLTETGTSGWEPGSILPYVVLLWLLGLVIGVVRLSISFGRVRRMRSSAERAVPAAFDHLVRQLAQRIGYLGKLRIALSSAVDGPALVGHLKPILLFPVAMINQLTPEQAEAVILHELAHLQRKDHWWNLLQCLIEVLFQYHPMIWWIGARIREEREHCCDDVVLAYGPGGLPYAKALLYFETQRSTPTTAVALTNNPGGLLGRVQRFLHKQNIPYQMKSRLFLLPLLGLIALVSTAAYVPSATELSAEVADASDITTTEASNVANRNITPDAVSAPLGRIVPPAIDTLPRGRHKVTSYRNGKSTEFVVEDGAIQSLKIDGKDIPSSEYDEHQPMIERMLGTNETKTKAFFWNGRDLEDMELELEGEAIEFETLIEKFSEDFEGWGGSIESLGERIGEDFEGIFEDGANVFRFRSSFPSQEFSFDFDSLPGSNFRFFADSIAFKVDTMFLRGDANFIRKFNSKDIELDGDVRILRDGGATWITRDGMRKEALSDEEKIREMETMLERLERKKAAMKRELEAIRNGEAREMRETERKVREERRLVEIEVREAQREALREQRDAELEMREAKVMAREAKERRDGPDYESIVKVLQGEGLIPEGEVNTFKLDNSSLKINGKKMAANVHSRFIEVYQERYGDTLGKKFQVKYQHKEN